MLSEQSFCSLAEVAEVLTDVNCTCILLLTSLIAGTAVSGSPYFTVDFDSD